MMENTQCNICLDIKSCFRLPCCNGPAYCMPCINVLVGDLQLAGEAEQPHNGGAATEQYGECPTCKKDFVKNGDNLSRPSGKCYMCGHNEKILAAVKLQAFTIGHADNLLGLCDNCWICEAYPERYEFQYECEGCNNYQTIPHPMYRYQAKSYEFSEDTWFCHQRCNAQTTWRIKAEYVNRVPAAERPATWNE